MKKPNDGIKHYLEYLDKEMTIEGILSAFCVAVVGLVLEKVLGAEAKVGSALSQIQAYGYGFVVAGSGAVLSASLFFYLQRSYLARVYGEIATKLADDSDTTSWNDLPDARELIWIPYKCGFGALTVAASEYGLALGSRYRYYAFIYQYWAWWICAPPVLGLVALWLWHRYGPELPGSTLAETAEAMLEKVLERVRSIRRRGSA